MKYKNIFWGVILILIGSLFVLRNTGLIYFNWSVILRLWPLILIVWGISILPVKDYMKLILSFLIVILSFVLINNFHHHHYNHFHKNFVIDKEIIIDKNDYKEQKIETLYDSTITNAVLKFDAAMGDFIIADTTDKMIVVNKKGNTEDYKMSSKTVDSLETIKIKPKNSAVTINNKHNNVSVKLNPNPVWDLDFDMGAVDIVFDLSMFKTHNIKIDAGVSSIDIKLGDKYKNTKLDIDAGVSSILIQIPKKSGCEVKINTVLSDNNLQGFKKIKKHIYRTDNFENSNNKIFINVDAALSSFDVRKY